MLGSFTFQNKPGGSGAHDFRLILTVLMNLAKNWKQKFTEAGEGGVREADWRTDWLSMDKPSAQPSRQR